MALTQELDEVLELTIRMADSKKDLLSFISYFNGERSDEYWDADFLVKSDEDLERWFVLYNGNPDEVSEANTYFRRWKMDQHRMSLDEFEDLWELDKEGFVETVFQQRYMDRWTWELESALGNGLTMKILYERYMENKYSRVEYLSDL